MSILSAIYKVVPEYGTWLSSLKEEVAFDHVQQVKEMLRNYSDENISAALSSLVESGVVNEKTRFSSIPTLVKRELQRMFRKSSDPHLMAQCLECEDTGIVSIWNPEFIHNALSMAECDARAIIQELARRLIAKSVATRCHCSAGDKFMALMMPFDRSKHHRIETGSPYELVEIIRQYDRKADVEVASDQEGGSQ